MLDIQSHFPDLLSEEDIKALRKALQLATGLCGNANDPAAVQQLAVVVFRNYQRGVTNPEKLAALAAFLSSSRSFTG